MKISAMVSKLLRGPVSVLKIRNREIILSDAALHLYNILQKYLLRFKNYRPDMISLPNISKGNNSVKLQVELWFLISARCVIMLYICTKFSENV